jgi:hypothetical protein
MRVHPSGELVVACRRDLPAGTMLQLSSVSTRRPSRWRRSWSGVFWIACSMPTMASRIPLSWMKRPPEAEGSFPCLPHGGRAKEGLSQASPYRCKG